jgi:excisionase family DNA binding protein
VNGSRSTKTTSRPSEGLSANANQILLIAGGKYMKAEAIAREIGVSVQKVRDLIEDGELAAFKIGKEYLIPQESYHSYIARRAFEAEQQAEAKRKQRVDPSGKWSLELCVGCGERHVVCTRDDRNEGWILCPTCDAREGEEIDGEREEYFSVKNDRIAWRRTANIQRDEANRAHLERHGTPGKFEVNECDQCGCPLVIDKAAVYEPKEDESDRDETDVLCAHPRPWRQ